MFAIHTWAQGTGDNSEAGSSSGILDTLKGYLTDPELLTDLLLDKGSKLVLALLIFGIGRLLAKFVSRFIRKLLSKQGDATLTNFLGSIVYMLLMTVVVMASLEQLGVKTTGFAAVLAAAGFAIGLAMQGSLSNFAAGVLLMFFRPIKVGDFIEGGGTSGTVLEIGVFATTLKTADNKRIVVPNSGITNGNITNFSAHATRRIDLVVGVSYGDDLKQVKDLLTAIVHENPKILADPAPVVAVSELGDSSVNFVCRPWVNTPDYWDVRFDLVETIKLRFDAAGISIPFPQRDVHLHQSAS